MKNITMILLAAMAGTALWEALAWALLGHPSWYLGGLMSALGM